MGKRARLGREPLWPTGEAAQGSYWVRLLLPQDTSPQRPDSPEPSLAGLVANLKKGVASQPTFSAFTVWQRGRVCLV